MLDRAVLTKVGLVGPYVGVEDELEFWVAAVAVTVTPLLLAFALASVRLRRAAGTSRRQHGRRRPCSSWRRRSSARSDQ